MLESRLKKEAHAKRPYRTYLQPSDPAKNSTAKEARQMSVITLGSMSFSGGLLSAFAAIFVVLLAGNRIGRARGIDVERSLWMIVGAAVVTARVAFVSRFSDLYLAAPLTILDIRDGGFSLAPGLLAGMAVAVAISWRYQDQSRPVMASVVAGLATFGLFGVLPMASPVKSQQLPQMILNRVEGGTIDTTTLRGKPVVLNLWASWCPPCQREMPVLREAQLRHPDITFIFVNQGETRETTRTFLAGQTFNMNNVVLDPWSTLAKALGTKGLPTTFFFDDKGVLVDTRVGEVSAATLAQRIARIQTPRQ